MSEDGTNNLGSEGADWSVQKAAWNYVSDPESWPLLSLTIKVGSQTMLLTGLALLPLHL